MHENDQFYFYFSTFLLFLFSFVTINYILFIYFQIKKMKEIKMENGKHNMQKSNKKERIKVIMEQKYEI